MNRNTIENLKILFEKTNNNDDLAGFRENLKEFIKKHVYKVEKAKHATTDKVYLLNYPIIFLVLLFIFAIYHNYIIILVY